MTGRMKSVHIGGPADKAEQSGSQIFAPILLDLCLFYLPHLVGTTGSFALHVGTPFSSPAFEPRQYGEA